MIEYYLIILKKWEDVFPDLNYKSLEAMYILMEEKIEVSLKVGYCEYVKSMSGHPGFAYVYNSNLDCENFTVYFPLLHNRKQSIRREWIDHIEKVDKNHSNKQGIVDYYLEHNLQLPKKGI